VFNSAGSEQALLNFGALAELFVFMGDHGRARAVLSAGLASRRPTARFLRTAALLERRLGDAAAAAQLLARAVARAPRDYRSWLAVSGC
jgi:Tfp pilus assembly protein PilF